MHMYGAPLLGKCALLYVMYIGVQSIYIYIYIC